MSARNRLTLLDIVQRCLDAMNHDNVNSINATVESRQIAKEAKTTYYDLMDRGDWSHLMQHIQLEGIIDPSRPNFLKIPAKVVRIDDLRYESTDDTEAKRKFTTVTYLQPVEFIDLVLGRDSEDENTITVRNHNNISMFIIDNKSPEYWTSFDDEYVVFDSYDKNRETTLHSVRSLALAKVIPDWQETDTFVPDMPDQMFSVFLAEVTAASFLYWKQTSSPKDEQRSARGISRLRHDARKVDEYREKTRNGRRRGPSASSSRDGRDGSIFHAGI